MEIDEIVETSDVDELEEELHLRRASSVPLGAERRTKSPSVEQINSSPPRKRLKTFHEGSQSPPTGPLSRLSVSPAKSGLLNLELQLSQSSTTAINPSSPRWQSVSTRSPSRTSFEDLASPGKPERESLPQVDYSQAPLSPHSLPQHTAILFSTPPRSPLASLTQYENRSTPSAIAGTRRDPSTPPPKTPPYSPPERQRHFMTQYSYFGQKATHTPSLFANARAQDAEEGNAQVPNLGDDELLLFTPTNAISATMRLSPMSPLTQRSLSPLSVRSSPVQSIRELTPAHGSLMGSLPSSPMPIIENPPTPAPPPPPQDNDPIDMNHIPEESRYSLRKRNVAQLNPYTVENMRYQRALRSNPDAIVKMKALERLNHHHSGNHYEPDGETQGDVYLDEGAPEDEDSAWGEKERRRLELRTEKERRRQERAMRQASVEQDKARYPEILRDLTDSDDEDMTALEKEARKAARRKEKEERARLKGKQREKEAKLHQAKRFSAPAATPPSHSKSRTENSDGDVEMVDDAGLAGPSRLPSLSAEERALRDYFRGYDHNGSDAEDGAGPSNNVRQLSAPAPIDEDVYQDLFGDDMNMHQDDWQVDEANQDIAPHGSSKAPYAVESDLEQSDEGQEPSQASRKVPDVEPDISPQKIRWLKKVLPKGMWYDRNQPRSGKAKAQKAKRAERRAQSIASDADPPGPLLPGQTRVQKAANPKDIRDIKGDTESESESASQAEDVRTFTPEPAMPIAPHPGINENDSDSDVVEILESYRTTAGRLAREVYSSEDEIDDEDIQEIFFPAETSASIKREARLRDESLIDYMLTRTRYIGGKRKGRPKPHVSQPGSQDMGPSKPPKYKLDVTTRGARGHGHERQTLLSFDNHKENKRPHDRALERTSSSRSIHDHLKASGHRQGSSHVASNTHRKTQSSHRTGSSNRLDSNKVNSNKHRPKIPHHTFLEDDDGDDGDGVDNSNLGPVEGHMPDLPEKLNWKERERARKKRTKMNGIWSNNTPANQVVSSGIGKIFTTVAIEKVSTAQLERRFQFALAPKNATQAQRDHWSKKFKPPPSPPRRIRKGRPERSPVEDNEVIEHLPSRKTENRVGMGVRALPAGRKFAASTSIGKGWLYELINLAAGAQEPALPLAVTLCGFSLDPSVGLEAICDMLPQITDSFFDFVTALPDLDQDMLNSQWVVLAHVVSQHLSWFLKAGDAQQTTTLRKVAETQILQMVDRIKERALKFVDTPAMILGWFSVEMSVRIAATTGLASSLSTNKLLKISSALLMNLLLQFGVEKTMEPIRKNAALDGSKAAHYAAEFWVCLIHVYTICVPQEVMAKPQIHPLWPALLEALRSHIDKEIFEPAVASETVWLTIFSLYALSQFSAHGMTLGQPRLTACWDAVLFALKQITLESTPGETGTETEKRRDAYIATVIKRCLHLHERWGWKLHEPSKLFNELANIFRSRKFRNLLHERCDFPDFVKLADPTLLSSPDNTDTAFMVFLKLIVRAAREDPVYIARGSSPKVKKWLSIAVPVGDVPLSEHTVKDEVQRALSMFYNRLAAVAVAIELDTTDYDDRTEKIRHYINFTNADPTTRFAIIRAMMYWSNILIARKVKLTPVLAWVEEIAAIIGSEFKKFPAKAQTPTTDDPEDKGRKFAIINIHFLISCIRQVFQAHIKEKVYPEPGLIAALKPMLTTWSTWSMSDEVDSTIKSLQEAFGGLGIVLFQARALVMPPPARPPLFNVVHVESQESQDFVMDDLGELDWDNIDLPEALSGVANHTPELDFVAQDKLLLTALKSVQFRWTVPPLLDPCLKPPADDDSKKVHESDCDKWIRLFLCCMALESQADKWHECLHLLDRKLKTQTDENWVCRVRLSIMYQLLQLDPMAYMTTEDRAMEAFLSALISDRVALEKEYVAHFLSISSLRHPLLHGVSDLPPRKEETGDFSFSVAEFQDVRTPLLKAIFHNVDEVVRKQARGDETVAVDVVQFLQMITKMLSTMRTRLTSLINAKQNDVSYRDFCHRVYLMLKDCPELFTRQELSFWRPWGAGLKNT